MKALLRRHGVTFVLIALAIAGLVALVVTASRPTTEETSARADNLLGAYREDDITRVEVVAQGGKTVLERGPADDAGDRSFFLREPVNEEADNYGADKLLGTFEFARAVRRIKPGDVDRAAFGLDAPTMTVAIDMSKIHYRLAFGKEAASPPGSVYVEVTGEGAPSPGVTIVRRDFMAELTVALAGLRSDQIVPYLSSTLARMLLTGKGGERKLRRDGEVWRFDGNHGDGLVDREALDRILLQFARTKAEKFLEPKVAEEALKAGESVEITLTPSDTGRKRAVVVVGGKCPDGPGVVALRREPDPIAGCAAESVMAGLATPADELVDVTPLALRRDEVEHLELSIGDKKLVLDRKETGFILRAPEKADVELDVGNGRISALVDAHGVLVPSPDLHALGLDPPRGHLTVTSAAADESRVRVEKLQIGVPDKDGSLHVRRELDGLVLKLDRDAARAFRPDASLVRSRKLFEFKSSEFRGLTLTLRGVKQVVRRAASNGYVLEEPKGLSYDAGLVTDVVDSLGSLEAERWVSDEDDGSYGLRSPWLRADVSWSGGDAGEKSATFVLGTPVSGGNYASIAGEPGVFVLPRRVVDTLDTLLLDRSPFMVAPDEVQRIELVTPTSAVTLDQQGDHFVVARGTALQAERIQRIVEALMTLRAEAATHLGAAHADEGLEKAVLEVSVTRQPGRGERSKPAHFRIGAGDSWRGVSVHYARADGVDATFVITRSKVKELLDQL